ncbi:MAG TPA: helix-turn-helix domain-containing protein [Gemmatimonadaceae bacterium]|nr:helix-turn-helix domain-containing protein [Gemmatimonadaceae bacterium]
MRLTTTNDALTAIAADWARIGLWLSVEAASEPVDVEALIVRTARMAREDERLFVGAASWLAVHHGWVNSRRLIALMTDLARIDRVGSAVAGALLTLASRGASGLETGRASELDGAIEACRPLARPRPLFTVMERFPVLRSDLRTAATPMYRRWGLWHDDESLKLTAIRPAAWLLRHVPELRVRAVVGPSLESDLITLALSGPLTARDVARITGVSYAAAHGAADRLVARGLLRRQRAGARQMLRLTGVATIAIPRSPRRLSHAPPAP